ncbi:hypothetical protein [Pseudomonas fluorescens]|uniref:hypothetical protein n=1 Tax=Pseudomonas fluorescens TaxID=294 RepID=UPI00177AB087|nr:hypothetical protein [Pseudomonas fluorescens]
MIELKKQIQASIDAIQKQLQTSNEFVVTDYLKKYQAALIEAKQERGNTGRP